MRLRHPKRLPSIKYVAFYGDVEREVAEVTSGYRLTLSYEYPLATKRSSDEDDELVRIAELLKGDDAADRAGVPSARVCAVRSTSATEGEGRISTSGLLRCATSFRISTANTWKGASDDVFCNIHGRRAAREL